MKTMTKRIASMALAVMMALVVLATAVPTSAFAAATGSLTIKSSNAGFDGKEVSAYKMMDATVSADGKNVAYKVDAAWTGFFQGLDGLAGKTADELDRAAVAHIESLRANVSGLNAFAKSATEYAKQHQIAAADKQTASKSGGDYVVTFAALPYGYYAISPIAGSTSERGTDAMLASVAKPATEIQLKSAYPTLDKTVENTDHVTAEIGRVLHFKLTSTVPNMDEYDTYVFKITDTLSKGLTLNADSVAIKAGDDTLVKDTDYTVQTASGNGAATTMTITVSKMKDHAAQAGKPFTVDYTATVNKHAVVGTDDLGNAAKLEYSNEPGNPDGFGTTTTDKTHGYTFGFDINKVDQDKKALAGAKFSLKKKDGGDIVKLVVENAGNGTDPMIVRAAKTGEEGVTEVETPESGKIRFRGLDAIAYQLVEVEAPSGYNKLDKPVDIVIAAQFGEGGVLTGWTVNGGDNAVAVEVENRAGTLLPGTGGIGTILFTFVGAAAIGYGIYRRRTAKTVA